MSIIRCHVILMFVSLLVGAIFTHSARAQTGEVPAPAATQLAPVSLPGILVTGAARSSFDVPASISSVSIKDADGKNIQPSEYLRQVPGVRARSRENYAQDEQISIRGYGARASFGVRGVRLYSDGIPATMPDGQGQLSSVDLDAADRIEVLRGPFSALYGNSSGGVIRLFSADGTQPSRVIVRLGTGPDHTFKQSLGARGVRGALDYNLDLSHMRTQGYRDHSRAERDDVYNVDEYAEAIWRLAPCWSLSAGARHSEVRFSTVDHYAAPGNPDDSGRVAYVATTPVAGLMFRANANWHLYASYGQGFETPTFNELSYRADGSGGLAFDLQAAHSRNAEIGSKLRWGDHGMLDLAFFRGDTRNELGVDTSAGGRTTYRNIGRARRQGAELQAVVPIADDWTLRPAYTYLDARVDLSAQACDTGATCNTSGNRLPGVPRNALDLSLDWAGHRGWRMGLDGQAIGGVPVNDANRASAPGYALLGAHMGFRKQLGHTRIDTSLRLHNLLDQRYISAVVVNQSNGRYFEPGPARGAFIVIRIQHAPTAH